MRYTARSTSQPILLYIPANGQNHSTKSKALCSATAHANDGADNATNKQPDDSLPITDLSSPETTEHEDLKNFSDAPQLQAVEKKAVCKKKLYALLVGLDDYNEKTVLNDAVIFPKLSGCVADTNRLKTYVENDSAFDSHIKHITNKEATKKEIARLFQTHLGQAKKGDTALFFFSGHGTQEWADTVWREESDGKLECIVCYYDNASDDILLADKELRFLLHELAANGAHIVALFDCCHSADNTRNGELVKKEFTGIVEKRVPYVFPKRPWESFLFSDVISAAELAQKGEATLLPQGAHVQMSACESNESALEVAGSGVFTQTLLRVLKSAGGDVSYQSLGGRMRQYLKNVYEQKPRIYTTGDADLLDTNFLNRPSTGQKRALGELVYNEQRGWKLTLGAIHGITAQTKSVTITDIDAAATFSGTINDIEIDCCFVTTPASLDTTKAYNGSVAGLLAAPLKISIQNTGSSLQVAQALCEFLFNEGQYYTVPEEAESKADYVVRLQNDFIYITYPYQPFQPLTAPQPVQKRGSAQIIASQVVHISQWQFLKNLANGGDNKLPDGVLQIDVTIGNQTTALDETNAAVISYHNTAGNWENTLMVTLTNTTRSNLYVTVLYLTSDFGSDVGLLNPQVYFLEPGNKVALTLDDDATLPLLLNEVAKFYNWKEEVEYLKFIISSEPFDVQAVQLEALPKPPVPGGFDTGAAKDISTTRGLGRRALKGWTTQQVTLQLQNPLADNLNDADKKRMYADAATAVFARGLYPDVKEEPEHEPVVVAENRNEIKRDGGGIILPKH